MRKILTSLVLVASAYSFAQVGISASTSDTPEATLDVRAIGGSTADGILIPRVDRAKAQNMANVKESTLIYVNSVSNGAQAGQAADIDATGFYYFKGSKWIKLGGGATPTATETPGIATLTHFSNSDYTLKSTDTTVVCDKGATIKVIIPASQFVEGRNFVLLNNNCSGGLIVEDESGSNVLTGNSTNVDLQEGIGQHLYYDGNKWFNTTGY